MTTVTPKSEAIEAWHFLPSDGCLQHEHNGTRGPRVEPGLILSVRPPLLICKHGLHASRRAIDALEYAPGSIVCRVLCWGDVVEAPLDKLCAEHREVLWLEDCDDALGEFACLVAEQSLDLIASKGLQVDDRSRRAIDVKRRWIAEKATKEELNAAWSAAWSAAESAAASAAWSAAACAARSAACAAESAAWSAAWSAAERAAWSASSSAAWNAARNAQNDILESMWFALNKETQ